MADTQPDITWLTRPDGPRIAMRHHPGRDPGILFIHGLMSDMEGEKARYLADHAGRRGRDYRRFDLSGHGRSDGAFENGSISRWREDALLALDASGTGPVVLVGSSIGGWIALLAALARPERVLGMLLLAPAPDMTERLAETLPDEACEALREHGVWLRPSAYGAPIPITRLMLDDGNRHCLLDRPIELFCPVRILHGQQDADVPWQGSLKLAERLQSSDVQTLLLKQGDHRLSQPHELAVLGRALDTLLPA